jgi:hypothetical protein
MDGAVAELCPHVTSKQKGWRGGGFSKKSIRLWEMAGEQFAGAFDAVDDAFPELCLAEISGHRVRQFLPERIAALGMHGFIADHREAMRTRGDEDQDAIAIRRMIESLPEKFLLRGGHGIVHGPAHHHDADPAGGF